VPNNATPDSGRRRNVEFLSKLCAQDAREMRCMVAGQGGAIALDFIGDPAAAGD